MLHSHCQHLKWSMLNVFKTRDLKLTGAHPRKKKKVSNPPFPAGKVNVTHLIFVTSTMARSYKVNQQQLVKHENKHCQ